jgi:CHAT domain-containing protein
VQGLPFEAIQAAGGPEGAGFTVSYAPSGTIYARLAEARAKVPAHDSRPRRLLALGDPVFTRPPNAMVLPGSVEPPAPLPGTRLEVEAITALFAQSTRLLGSDASRRQLDQLRPQLKDYRVIHLATHGYADRRTALGSALILAQDQLPDALDQSLSGKSPDEGRLTAFTIRRDWQLDADLVTLSACQTGLGRATLGEGHLGFSNAFLASGARSLIVSQWKVSDTATTLLMIRFYENWLGTRAGSRERPEPAGEHGALTQPRLPMSKAEALREAKDWLRNLTRKEAEERLGKLPEAARGLKIESLADSRQPKADQLSADKPFAHPCYWSAFVLIGDPE